MPEFRFQSFQGVDGGLFAPEEVWHLMRAEFDRARRYRYPLACLLIGVDRLGHLKDLYGHHSKAEILQATVELLRTVTREGDFLGSLVDDRVLALVPHTPPLGAEVLGERLLGGARRLEFESDGRPLRITVSVGAAHNERDGVESLGDLLQVASQALARAVGDGGDQCVAGRQRQEEDGVAQLRRQVEEMRSLLHARDEAPAPPAVLEESERRAREAELAELRAELESLQRAHDREVGTLGRRIQKLVASLATAEHELRRSHEAVSIEEGVPSIFRTVQGLREGESKADLKRTMMAQIFEANLKLKSTRDRSR